MKNYLLFFILLTFSLQSYAQGLPINSQLPVSINENGNLPDNSAMLDVKSTTKGVLVPRMTSAQRNSINSPANGLFVYDTNTKSFWFYNGSVWKDLALDTNLTEAQVDSYANNNGYLLYEVDGDVTNELELPLNPTTGTMVYYNGSDWIPIAPGTTGDKLCYCYGVPTWGDCPIIPTCSDGIQNQGETGVDCGGPCSACPTCSDNIQNQGETGTDCGGPCPACPSPCLTLQINYLYEGGGGICTDGVAYLSGAPSNASVAWTWAIGGFSGTNNGNPSYAFSIPAQDWTGYYLSICATVTSGCSPLPPKKCKSFLLECGGNPNRSKD